MKSENYKRVVEILIVLIIPAVVISYGNYLGIESNTGLLLSGILGYLLYIGLTVTVFRRNKLNILDFGFNTRRKIPATVLLGLGLFLLMAIIYFIIGNLAAVLFKDILPPTDLTRFDSLKGNNLFLVFTIIASWTTITFGEEIVYRVFLVNWLHRIFEDSKTSKYILSIVLSGLMFGLAHFIEGPVGFITTTSMGILFSWVYIKSNKNIWITIIAHGLLNTVRFLFIYFAIS